MSAMGSVLTTRLACSFPAADTAAVANNRPPDPAAVRAFKRDVRRWARKIDVHPTSITVREMTTKWGSCSVDGRLTFDHSLVLLPEHLRAEVIAHELLHLRVPNHGPLFRSLLRAYLAPTAARTSPRQS